MHTKPTLTQISKTQKKDQNTTIRENYSEIKREKISSSKETVYIDTYLSCSTRIKKVSGEESKNLLSFVQALFKDKLN